MRRISIIMPVLNEAPRLPTLLNKLQSLRAQGHELIVVDGGSQDSSLELANAQADAILQTPAGRARQMNAGAACARSEILLFLHADTMLPEHAIQAIHNAMQQYRWGFFAVRFDSTQRRFRLIAAAINIRTTLTGIAGGDQAIFVQRAFFQRIGGFAEIPLMEDIALCKTLRKHARPACLREKVISSSRRWQQHGTVKTILLMWWLRLRFFLGASPNKLVQHYYPKLAHRKDEPS